METEQLLTAAKWEILENLSKRSMSPLELSRYVNGSLANISQSLRLLEFAGIVKSKRVPNRDKGQPRILYSLKSDFAYPVVFAKHAAHKELMQISRHRKAILKTWYHPNKRIQPAIEKSLWLMEEQFENIDSISVDATSSKLTFYILPAETAKKIKITTLTTSGNKYSVEIKSTKADSSAYHILFSKKMMEVIPKHNS